MTHAIDTLEILHAARQAQEPAAAGRVRRFGGLQNQARLTLLWPDLTVSSSSANMFGTGGLTGGGNPGLRLANLVAGDIKPVLSLIWGQHEPTKEDWLTCLILLHPTMSPAVTQALAELDKLAPPANPAPEVPAESNNQPVKY